MCWKSSAISVFSKCHPNERRASILSIMQKTLILIAETIRHDRDTICHANEAEVVTAVKAHSAKKIEILEAKLAELKLNGFVTSASLRHSWNQFVKKKKIRSLCLLLLDCR